jgi:purine-binding chemotaxis protein CheW
MKGAATDPEWITEAKQMKDNKYLTFILNKTGYGVHILKVREIIGMMPVTQVPQTPEFVRGVVNLRGKVIPVIDLRLRFQMEAVEATDRTCIIVMEIETAGSTLQIGVVVDGVSEVIALKEADIQTDLPLGRNFNSDLIQGVAKQKDGIKILLDLDQILSSDVAVLLNHAA